MSDFDDLLRLVMELKHEVSELKHVVANQVQVGTVEELDATKGYRLKLGEDANGKPVLSPWYPHPEAGGALKTWQPLTKGEIAYAVNPSGDPRQGYLIRGGFSDQNPQPSKKLDENVRTFGKFREEQRADDLTIQGGKAGSGSALKMTADGQVTVAGGDQLDTAAPELNEQLKGLAARVAQAETQIHGLFDATSWMHNLLVFKNPELLAIAHIFTRAPGGLETLVGGIASKAQAYLQTTLQQALGKVLNPNLSDIAGLFSGGQGGDGQVADIARKAASFLDTQKTLAAGITRSLRIGKPT